jgi:hypothetical protein
MILVRWWSASQPSGGDPHSLTVAVDNLRLWSSPAFVGAFAYFSVTLFGGISALLAVRARWCASRLREQPEMVTYLVVVVGAAVVGNLDIWRYLAYALPIALLLVGQYLEGDDGAAIRRTLAAVLLFTVVTQRPFQAMDAEQYLRDWFPLYPYFGAQPAAAGLTALWIARAASVVLLMVALHAMVRRRPPAHGAAIMTPGVPRSA